MANEFLESENYLKAESSYKKALLFSITDIDKTQVLFELADLYLINEEFIKAKKCYEDILTLDKKMCGAYYGLSLVNDFMNGEVQYSIDNYKKAIECDPKYDRAYYYLAHAYDRDGKQSKALEMLNKCIELNPSDYVAYNDIGAFLEESGEYNLALEYFEKSLKLNNKYARALFNMGVVLKRLNRDNEALEFYNDALKYSSNPNIYLNLSAFYIEKREYMDAVKILDQGIKENPENVNLYYNRSCSKALLNMIEDAFLDIKMAMKLDNEVINWANKDPDLIEVMKLF